MKSPLLPAQQQAMAGLERAIAGGHVAVLSCRQGAGRTSILRALHGRVGGAYYTSREFIEASLEEHPLALEETTYRVLKTALESHDAVFVDDFHFISYLSCCSQFYPRMNFLAAAVVPLVQIAQDEGKTLLFATDGVHVPGLSARVPEVRVRLFAVEDYEALATHHMGPARAATIDMRKVHRFAPTLSARQLTNTCTALLGEDQLDTDRFVQYLRENHMVSNVDLGEVQAVELKDLHGVDDVIEALEANVILPLENTEVAEELDLKPKRGVLLAGPPGTGKTTIGRALAHRLKSKFFLIDGTVVSGTPDFYYRIHRIFEAAKRNAPGIIFIDDSDVIFETGQETGLYRYLLTMLDGLESESAGRVCLMMTAMDVGNLPPALVRSGRVELWLQTGLPLENARAEILADHCANLPAAVGEVDIAKLAKASEGLSGADLKRVVEDGKLLFAFDRTRNAPPQPATTHFLRAIATVRKNKEQYAEAEAAARARHPVRPAYFDAFGAGAVTVIDEIPMPRTAHMRFGEEQ